jgi:hypothetical protein
MSQMTRLVERIWLNHVTSKGAYGIRTGLPAKAGEKPDSGSAGRITPGSELNPHLRAVLERLKERDRERRE